MTKSDGQPPDFLAFLNGVPKEYRHYPAFVLVVGPGLDGDSIRLDEHLPLWDIGADVENQELCLFVSGLKDTEADLSSALSLQTVIHALSSAPDECYRFNPVLSEEVDLDEEHSRRYDVPLAALTITVQTEPDRVVLEVHRVEDVATC